MSRHQLLTHQTDRSAVGCWIFTPPRTRPIVHARTRAAPIRTRRFGQISLFADLNSLLRFINSLLADHLSAAFRPPAATETLIESALIAARGRRVPPLAVDFSC
jgi:hypothetical protein